LINEELTPQSAFDFAYNIKDRFGLSI